MDHQRMPLWATTALKKGFRTANVPQTSKTEHCGRGGGGGADEGRNQMDCSPCMRKAQKSGKQ